MIEVSDGEVKGYHGPGVSQDQELAPLEDAFLLGGQVVDAEEAGSFPDLLGGYDGRCVDGPAGIEQETDRESVARHVPVPRPAKGIIGLPELRPGCPLFGKKPLAQSLE